MGYSIKNAQDALRDCIKRLPLGDILLTIAPIIVIIIAVGSLFDFLNIANSQSVSNLFRVVYFVYVLSMLACFATNKLLWMLGVLCLKAIVFISYMIRSGIYMNAIINFLGYIFLAYVVYYIYLQRKTIE